MSHYTTWNKHLVSSIFLNQDFALNQDLVCVIIRLSVTCYHISSTPPFFNLFCYLCFVLFCFRNTPGSVHGSLYAGFGSARDWNHVSCVLQDKYSNYSTISPAIFIYSFLQEGLSTPEDTLGLFLALHSSHSLCLLRWPDRVLGICLKQGKCPTTLLFPSP